MEEQLASASVVARIVIGRCGTIDAWDDAAMRLLGWSRSEVLGKNFLMIVPTARTGSAAQLHDELFAGGALASPVRVAMRHKDGRHVRVVSTFRLERDPDGNVVTNHCELRPESA